MGVWAAEYMTRYSFDALTGEELILCHHSLFSLYAHSLTFEEVTTSRIIVPYPVSPIFTLS